MSTTTLSRIQSNIFISIFILPFVIVKKIISVVFHYWRFSSRLFIILSFFAVVGLFSYFIYQVNASVKERYDISKYLSSLEEITKENQNLELKVISVDSSITADALMAKLNFEKTDKVSYIKVLENKVVKK
jgi:cytochrome c-type biogenesis protein CcmE